MLTVKCETGILKMRDARTGVQIFFSQIKIRGKAPRAETATRGRTLNHTKKAFPKVWQLRGNAQNSIAVPAVFIIQL